MPAIYVISVNRMLVKVGRSQDPDARLRGLQTASSAPLTLEYAREITSAARVEREVHQLLAPWHKTGEWFACDPDLAVMAIHSIVERRRDRFSKMAADRELVSPLADRIREATRRIAMERRT
jgi:hypothetical protein